MEEQSFENCITTIIEAVRKASSGDSSVGMGGTGKGDALDLLVDAIEDHLRRSRKSQQLEESFESENSPLLALINSLPDHVYLKDRDSRFVLTNKAQAIFVGASDPKELIGKTSHDFFPKDLADRYRADDLRIIESGIGVANIEELSRATGGVLKIVLTTKVPLFNAAGAVTGLVGISRDITESRRGESELSLERSLLRALMENIPDHIYFKDAQSRFIRDSKAHSKLFGLNDAAEVVGKTEMDFLAAEHARQAFEDEQRIIRTGEPIINKEEKETWPDRPDAWVLTTKMPLRDQQGTIVGTFGISRDITERKQAEERIQDLSRLADESPNPVIRVSLDGSILYENRSSQSLLASWAGARGGKIPPEQVPELLQSWASGEKRKIEVREGKNVFALTITPVLSRGYINLYGRDVTEEKSLAEKFLQAQKMEAVGRLAGGIAHDFNNLLTVIGGYCDLLKEELLEGSPVRAQVDEIARATTQAATLTTQLLAFSRKQVLIPQVINPNRLVKNVENILARLVGEDVELSIFLQPEAGNFKADQGQIEQVLMNLVVNARDAMPEGGKLTIETSNRTIASDDALEHPGAKSGEYVRIAVSDTGHGMDREVLSHIFEPFYTTKEQGKGTGLGHSTVYGIVKQSEGYIACQSELGAGTTFTIYFPCTAAALDRTTVPSGEIATLHGGETILLVEDEEMVRRFIRKVLENNGYKVIGASTGMEALSAMESKKSGISLLVTDVVMPHMSGKELAQKLLRACPELKVLFISGYTGDAIIHHRMFDPGIDFLQKPFNSLKLLAKIREILNRQ